MTVEAFQITDRASWLAMRQHDVTASDVGAVCGVDPWRSALRVYAEKLGLAQPVEETKLMRRGRWLEPAVIEALREQRPDWEIKRAGVYLRDAEARLGATPDAVANNPARLGFGAVQCKVISATTYEREWPGGRPPLRYELQTLTEAMLLEADWAIVAALVISAYDAELVVADVERHAGAETRIRQAVARFWSGVVAERPPHPDYRIDGKLIEALHQYPEAGLVRDWSDSNWMAEVLADRAALKAEHKDIGEQIEALDAEIKDALGDAEGATLPGWQVTWKAQTVRERVVPASTFRVLRITDRREKDA